MDVGRSVSQLVNDWEGIHLDIGRAVELWAARRWDGITMKSWIFQRSLKVLIRLQHVTGVVAVRIPGVVAAICQT